MPALTLCQFRARGIFSWIARLAIAAVIAAPLTQVYAQPLPAASSASPAPLNYLDKQEERQFNLNYQVLKDTRTKLDTRRDAAAAILDEGWAIAIRRLKYELGLNDISTQRAIALAVAEVDAPSTQLIEPLMALLQTQDAELRREVAAALGRYESEKLVDRLIAMAKDDNADSVPQRRGAIRALAEHRQPRVIQTLLALARTPDQSLRPLVFESLAQLTGIENYGNNLALWEAWWQRAQKLDQTRLLNTLLRNISARKRDANGKIQSVTASLTEAHARLYDATPDAARGAALEKMLVDPIAEVRLQGLKLVERRLLNSQGIEETLRAAMRSRLIDDHPPVRVFAARLLETMADAAAATQVTHLLDEQLDESVQRAYLGLLARVPVDGAVDEALKRMANPALRGPAIAVVIAAEDAGKLPREQASEVLTLVRSDLENTLTPDPNALRLLGRLGDMDDEPRLANWLKHADPKVKLAAAEALAADRWPLRALLDHLDDATLGPVVTQVVGRRGSQLAELMKLVEAEPVEVDRQMPWREAAVGICSRMNTEGLLALSRLMKDTDKTIKPSAALYEAMLTGASKVEIDPASNGDPALAVQLQSRRWEANYLLAEFYLDSGQPALVMEPLSRLQQTQSEVQKRRLGLLELSALLHSRETLKAEAHTSRLLSDTMGPSIETIAMLWCAAIEKTLANGTGGNESSVADARAMFDVAARIFSGKLTGEASKALDDLRHALTTGGSQVKTPDGLTQSSPKPSTPAPATDAVVTPR